jgi:hypothetical protein
MTKDKKTPRELVDDVAEIPDETLSELPHWARVLRDLCREAREETRAQKPDVNRPNR